ncbi:cation-transporting P-type ATPase [Hyphococcus sp.]|uniref:cation-transporting P-type ATPase n=1 Tax=Hyphococcus sp. TaxID=2038636 RepID=UPI003D0C61E9
MPNARDVNEVRLAHSHYSIEAARVLEELKSSAAGLSSQEAARRLQEYGPNKPPEPPKRSTLLRFLTHFHNILIYVLIGAAAITAVLGHWIDTGVILAVVIANAIIGFVQEGRAERAMESIQRMLAPHASALRDGKRVTLAGEELVPGDIVILEAGDKVPADIRLLTARGLQVQEAILTGESVPVEKNEKPVTPGAALGDQSSMAFSGTLATSGQGRGVVVATGAATEIGRISGMLSSVQTLTTPLVRQMNIFARWLTLLILILAGALLVFGYFVEHHEFSEMFMAVVGLSVAAIPEGLPAVLTITLAIGVQAMARRNAIVRRLPAIETLGSVSVICTDKTGTLTLNEMMVASVATAEGEYTVTGAGYEPEGDVIKNGAANDADGNDALGGLARGAALCNDAELHDREGVWSVDGDPMEGALLSFAMKVPAADHTRYASWKRIDAIPFDARHRFMATLHDREDDGAVIYVKGAPEQILAMCRKQQTGGGAEAPLNETYWREIAENFAAKGQRVLAIATRDFARDKRTLDFGDVENSLTLLGLVGLIDPPRPEAIEAISECHAAGIAVKMITGDHAGTAAAIGRQIGLKHADKVLTGADIDRMDDAELAFAVTETDIFARTSPEHKLRLVTALQSHNMTVAMTGDGVNDAPALKRADAGIAMGKKGSEAAKEAAEIVLADDNFASIAAAVREGRTVYDNITKVISWTLPTNGGETLIIVVALLAGLALPVTPIQILWVNLITAVTLGIALAFEPTEENTMRRPPRPRNAPLLNTNLAWHVVLVSMLFLFGIYGIFAYATDRGYPVELSRTLALNALVVLEIFHLFFIRNIYGTSLTWKAVRGTKVVWATVIAVTAAQFAITYAPPLQKVFETRPVPLFDGILIFGLGVLLFAILEIEKQLRLSIRRIGAAGNAGPI